MNYKKQIYLIIFVTIFFGSLVSAEILVSDRGVEYDSVILDKFQYQLYVEVIIHLENLSYLEELISEFSEDELRDVIYRDIPNRSSQSFGAEITESAFFKLLKDDRVEKIYYNWPVDALLEESAILINADDAWYSFMKSFINVRRFVL